MVAHSYFPADVRVWRYAVGLRRAGWDVDVHCLRDQGEAARETVEGIRVLRTALRRRRGSIGRYLFEYGWLLVSEAWRLLTSQETFDVVHVHTPPDFLVFAALPARWRGARVLLDLHEIMPEFFQEKYGVPSGHPVVRVLKRVEQASIRASDCAVTVSTPLRDRFIERGAPAESISVVMNAPDEEMFPHASSEYLTKGVVRDPFALVYHGTLMPFYGIDVAIRALAATRDRWPFHLHLYGSGEHASTLAALARELEVAERVTSHGRVPLSEIPSVLREAGGGIIPTRSGPMLDLSLSNKLLEMLWVGLPAIVADLPSYRQYVDDDAVLFFRAGDAGSLAQALERFAGLSMEERVRLARRAAANGLRVRWSDQLEQYRKVLRSVRSAQCREVSREA
jgi:glycosyltransferase involved in cell wall biosynthesis